MDQQDPSLVLRTKEGVSYTLRRIDGCGSYVKSKGVSLDEFDRMSLKDKEIVFLRWKWGGSDQSNRECEATRKDLLNMGFFKPDKEFDRLILAFEKRCEEVKKEMGLMAYSESEIPEEVRRVRSQFGGVVKSMSA